MAESKQRDPQRPSPPGAETDPAGPAAQQREDGRPRREISGPGAADFIAAPGGLDRPEDDRSKGTGALRDEGIVAQTALRANLDEPSPTAEREVASEDGDRARGRKQ